MVATPRKKLPIFPFGKKNLTLLCCIGFLTFKKEKMKIKKIILLGIYWICFVSMYIAISMTLMGHYITTAQLSLLYYDIDIFTEHNYFTFYITFICALSSIIITLKILGSPNKITKKKKVKKPTLVSKKPTRKRAT